MAIRALVFDFDGLILDTETPEVEVWKAIYAEHGQAYPREYWCQTIGGWGLSNFDPAAALQELTPLGLDLESLRTRHRAESKELILSAPVMPGVHEILSSARRLGLRCAIGSSSERSWVVPHLTRLGLLGFFDPVITRDDGPKGPLTPTSTSSRGSIRPRSRPATRAMPAPRLRRGSGFFRIRHLFSPP